MNNMSVALSMFKKGYEITLEANLPEDVRAYTESQIKLCGFLENCSETEICEMFNLGVFNAIAKAYFSLALKNCKIKNRLNVLREVENLFDEINAGEALQLARKEK